MKVSDLFYHRICGKLLGDGCITKQGNRKPRFQFIHRTEDSGWSNYGYTQLKDFIPLSAPVYQKVIDKRLKKGYSERNVVQSRTHPLITQLYEIWYPFGKKVVPLHFLNAYLNEEALSWWYQDDGHLKIVNGKMNKIVLSTDSFSDEENTLLIQLLFEKFKLTFAIDGQNRLLLYDQFQIIYFLHLVSPWMNASMSRKLPVEFYVRPIAKRTTIYLPTSINITKPTMEINQKLKNLSSLLCPKGKITCHSMLFKQFQQQSGGQAKISAFQIIIQEPYRKTLANIRQQTGLTVSQLVEYCFTKDSIS